MGMKALKKGLFNRSEVARQSRGRLVLTENPHHGPFALDYLFRVPGVLRDFR
jgi:hypothetical protein